MKCPGKDPAAGSTNLGPIPPRRLWPSRSPGPSNICRHMLGGQSPFTPRPPPWMLELSPELGGALQPDPGSHRALCSCHVFFRKIPLSQPKGQRERPEPGLDPALERPFGPRAQGPACQAPSGLFLAFIALPTLPPGKWEQPVARGVGGMSLWDPSSTGSPRTTVSLMTAPHSTPGLRAPPFLACCVSE